MNWETIHRLGSYEVRKIRAGNDGAGRVEWRVTHDGDWCIDCDTLALAKEWVEGDFIRKSMPRYSDSVNE